MGPELNSLKLIPLGNDSIPASSSNTTQNTQNINPESIHSKEAKINPNNTNKTLFGSNPNVDKPDLSNRMSNVDTSKIENNTKGFFSSITAGIKKLFGTQDINGPSKQSENLSTEQIQGAISFVSSHANGLDFDSKEFKQLDPKIQNYILAHYNQAVGKTSNTEN